MKNILFIIPTLEQGGGAEKVVSMIGSKLNDKGYNIKYLTIYNIKNKYLFDGEEICLNEKISKNFFVNIFKLFNRAWKIKKICKKNKTDICIAHMEQIIFSSIISKLFGNKSKVYIQIHQPLFIWSGYYQFLIKKLYKYADKIITIVKEEKNILINNYGVNKNKINVINNPINIEEINKLKKIKIHSKELKNENYSFINMGRLTYSKNQKMLIEVFIEFNKKYPKTELLILGDGELKNELIKISDKNENIKFLGNQKNPYNYLYNSNTFVFTSNFEGFGIAIIEAMQCELPIIATDCPNGPREIIKKDISNFKEVSNLLNASYGILIPNNSRLALFKAMEKLYLDKNLQNYYKKQSSIRASDFDINKIIKLRENIL